MTQEQIAWAATHDWFVCDNGDGTIVVREWFVASDCAWAVEQTWTGSFGALRAWAGY